jgi:Zn/Cd-binding protein ZinT
MLVDQTQTLVDTSVQLQRKVSDWESFWQTQGPLLWQAQESQVRLQTQLDQSISEQSALTTSLSSLQTSLDDSLKSLATAQVEAKAVLFENSLLKIGLYVVVPMAVVAIIWAVVK